MSSIIHSQTYGELIAYQDHLDSEADQSRLFTSLFKGTSLVGAGLSGLALVTLPGWGGLAMAGAVAGYVGAVIVETRKTGKLMPLPFVTLGLETVLKGVAGAKGGKGDDGDELTDYHYLNGQQKSDYALMVLLLPEIAEVLEAIPTEQARRIAFSQMRRRFHQAYSARIRHSPEMLAMDATKSAVAQYLFADADTLHQIASQPMPPALPTPGISPAPAPDPVDDYTQTIDTPVHAPESAPADFWVEPEPVGGPGPVTRESAVPVASATVAEYVAQVPVLEGMGLAATLTVARTALGQILQSPYKSRIFFGAQRSGKSMLVAICSQELAKQGVKVYHLNLLSYTKEGLDEDAQYTRHCVRSVRGDISKLNGYEVTALIEDAIAVVHEWWHEGNAILIVDEWAYLAAKDCQFVDLLQNLVGLIAGKMSALNSSGMKRTQAIYAVAPKMVATNLTDSGKVVKSMECVYVTVPPNRTVDWQGQGVGFDEQLFDQVSNNYAIFRPELGAAGGDSRIAFVGDRWLPLGTSPDMLMPAPQRLPPTPAPPVTPVPEPGFSVDDLMGLAPAPSTTEFVDKTAIPALRVAMQTRPDVEMFIDIINWLKSLAADGEEIFNLTQAAQAGWNKKAKDRGWLKGRSGDEAKIHLDKLTSPKYRLLAPESDGRSYRITLR